MYYSDLVRLNSLLRSKQELESLVEITQLAEVEDGNVTFPLDLRNGTTIELTLPKEDFIAILQKNITNINAVLENNGIIADDKQEDNTNSI